MEDRQKNNIIEFFIPLEDVPTKTAQEQRINCVNNKPIVYKDKELEDIENLFCGHLFSYTPDKPIKGPISLTTKWLFKNNGSHKNGEWKETKPDTTNLIKLFEDCMTKVGFWGDDCQVASNLIQKFWADIPGIYVKIEKL
ncbi:RusA family crossover junction endodeoxyribonuclease [Helcococcus kunzii]|uniref:RusA family crossover junction endodeoxyribonuclease n=1 Tax=Helcococcus kunzii TaxID=40091 RepID=UPI001BB0154A|nr:RusA family crossover junction endodeoxyribonuclease [Helcococcus kunzii]